MKSFITYALSLYLMSMFVFGDIVMTQEHPQSATGWSEWRQASKADSQTLAIIQAAIVETIGGHFNREATARINREIADDIRSGKIRYCVDHDGWYHISDDYALSPGLEDFRAGVSFSYRLNRIRLGDSIVRLGDSIEWRQPQGQLPPPVQSGLPQNFLETVQKGTVDEVKDFIEKNGVDVNTRTKVSLKVGYKDFTHKSRYTTLLHIAAYNPEVEVLKYLISQGADVNAKDNDGETPLHHTVFNSNIEVLKYLVSQGVDVNAKNNNGRTPLHLAANFSRDPEVLKYLVSQGADINAKDNDGETPVHCTAYNRDVEVLKYLISQGADVNAQDRFGRTLLSRASTEEKRRILREAEAEQPHPRPSGPPPTIASGGATVETPQEPTPGILPGDLPGHSIELNGHTSIITNVSFSPNGKKIVTSSVDGTVRIWDVESGKQLLRLMAREGENNDVAFSPDGTKIVVKTDKIQIWDAETGKHLRVLGEQPALWITFSPDGKKIVTINFDSTEIWDSETGKELHNLPGRFSGFSSDGKKMMTSADGIRIWDVDTGKELEKLTGDRGQFLPDGKKITTLDHPNKAIRIWDTELRKELQTLTHTDVAGELTFGLSISSDGKKIITGSFSRSGIRFINFVHIWDVELGKELQRLQGSIYDVSPDGTKIVLDGSILDTESGRELQNIGVADRFAFSPDGKKVVSAKGPFARVWTLSY